MATEEIDINSYYVSEQEIATALNNNSNKNGAEKIKEELDKKLNQAQSTSYNGRFLKVKNGQITPEEVTIPSAYVHPTPSNLNGAKTPQQIYKITTDSQGHVNTAAPITASDLPNNIPVSKLTNLSTLNLSSFTVDDNFQIPYSSVQGRPEVLTDLPATNFKITANMIEAGLISYDALNSNVYTDSISSSSSKLVTSSGVYTALQGKANSVHTHKKNDITDFSHTHKKNEITDFTHTHSKSNITDFAHTHNKSEITDFSHTHSKSEITDFAHTHDNYLTSNDIKNSWTEITNLNKSNYGLRARTFVNYTIGVGYIQFGPSTNFTLGANKEAVYTDGGEALSLTNNGIYPIGASSEVLHISGKIVARITPEGGIKMKNSSDSTNLEGVGGTLFFRFTTTPN